MTSPDTNSNPWLPIDQAPRDGTEVEGKWGECEETERIRFIDGYWTDLFGKGWNAVLPTHFRHLTPPVPPSETARTCVLCGAPMIEKQMDTMGPFAEDQYRQTCHCVHNVANLSDALGHAKRDLTVALARAEQVEGERGVLACEVADLRSQLTAATARLAEVERERDTAESARLDGQRILAQALQREDDLRARATRWQSVAEGLAKELIEVRRWLRAPSASAALASFTLASFTLAAEEGK